MLIHVFIIVYLIIILLSLTVYDSLLKQQYNFHKEEWIKSGRPRGFLFCPDNSSTSGYYKGAFSNWDQKFSWVENDNRAKFLHGVLLKLKWLVIVFSIAFVPIVFVSLLIS